jgi:LPXTG-motif cell wall-anchored protein
MIQRTGLTFKRAGGLVGLAGSVTLIGVLLTSQGVAAGGNPDFEGMLSAASPTGFVSSPHVYDLSGGTVTIAFDVAVKNLTQQAKTVALRFSADHILTYNGTNVSDGQPGQPGITFNGPRGTTQAVIAGTQSLHETWGPNATRTLSRVYTFATCGYFQLDLWAPWKGSNGRDRATLASGFVRVLGCQSAPTPSPSPTPSPTGGVGGATSTPGPDSGVQGITRTPSTGAGSAWLTLGGTLVLAGAGMLFAASRRRRSDI